MKYVKLLIAVLLAMSLTASAAPAQQSDASFAEQFQKQLDEWLPGISKGDRDPQQQFQQRCFELGTPGREMDRAAACRVIAAALEGELDKPARLWLIKQCQYIGGEECVDAVAKSLDDDDVHIRDAARRALTDNPARQANDRLVAKLASAKGTFRIGLINALGYRADPSSVGALTAALGDRDATVASAAANALGKIANAEAAKALKAALGKAPADVKADIADACLRCAEQLLAQGNRAEAIAIYNELAKDGMPRPIRLAALKGKLNAAAKKNR